MMATMTDILTAFLMIVGCLSMLTSAIGIVRMPDLFTRMHAASKVGTVGVSCAVLAAATHFAELSVVAPVLLTIVFFFATAPIAAHVVGRAAYGTGVRMWEGTVLDEWKKQPERKPYKPPEG
jgi:multicomponent Na+:H+ antiporter subunit G